MRFFSIVLFVAILVKNSGFVYANLNMDADKKDRTKVIKQTIQDLEDEVQSTEQVIGETLEKTRQTVSTRVIRLADTIDTLFGDKRVDDQKNVSTLRVSQRYFSKSGVTGGEDVSVTLNLHLPNFEQFKEKWAKKMTPEELANRSKAQVGTTSEKEESPWTLNQESGVVVANPVNYFARLRLRRDFISRYLVHSFYEQVGWSKANEWEEETSVTSDHALSRSWLARFVNVKYWGMTNNTFGTVHGPSLLHQISDTKAISLDLRYFTTLENQILYGDRITAGSLYRSRLPIGWIYMDVNPEIAWERKSNFTVQYNFYLRLEFVFGNQRK